MTYPSSQTTSSTEHPATPTSILEKPHYLLIVDDDTCILNIAVGTLSAAGYTCLTARSASQALLTLKNPNYLFDLMISDVVMSGMNGIDLMRHAIELLPNLPVIIMSGNGEIETTVEAVRAGSADFLVKPFDSIELVKCVERTLTRKATNIERMRVEAETANWKAAANAFALSLDARDKETKGHAERVVLYSVRLGQELGLTGYDLISLELGAKLHDIGKIAVPDSVLKKPAKLTDDEWVKMRIHPAKGQQMVREMGLPETAAQIVGQHHEQWNGSGYPLQLKGEEIALGARIFSVVDTFDAITSDRCYRRGRDYQTALDEIVQFSGIQFDPAIVEAFVRIPAEEWAALKRTCPSETVHEEQAIAC